MLETRSCGASGLQLPVVGLGCWAFGGGEYWGKQDQRDVDQVVRRAVELGVRYFDTAEAYNDGRSEESLGRAIRGMPRDQLIIGSKISPDNVHPAVLPRHCEASLRRLGTDHIDLYMVHWPVTAHSISHFDERAAPVASVVEACAALRQLQRAGKVRHVGVSNFAAARLQEVLDTGTAVAVNELPYSLLARAIEEQILPFCRDAGVGVIGYMPLWQGLLTDSYATLQELPPRRRRTRHFDAAKNALIRHGGPGWEADTWEAILRIRTIARQLGSTTAELALRWAAANRGIACVLAGARNVRQLEANASAALHPLEEDILRKLNRATDRLKRRMGPGFDYYESPANDRTL